MSVSLLHPRYHYKEYNNINVAVNTKETDIHDPVTGIHIRFFFVYGVRYIYEKAVNVAGNQAGLNRNVLGRPDFEFTKFSTKKIVKSYTIPVIKKTG